MFQSWKGYDPDPEFLERLSDEHRSFVGRWLDEKSKKAYREAYERAFRSEVTDPGTDSEAP